MAKERPWSPTALQFLSALHTHWEHLWVHIRNWFDLTKVNTGFRHILVTRIWGSYSNNPSLPCKPVTWPDVFQWIRWFISLPTRTHPHVVGVVFPAKAQTQLRLWPLPPCRRWDTVRSFVFQNSSLHLRSLSTGWKLQELVWFSSFLSLSFPRCTGCVTQSVLKGVWPAPSLKTLGLHWRAAVWCFAPDLLHAHCCLWATKPCFQNTTILGG